jgi:hypothetical protein
MLQNIYEVLIQKFRILDNKYVLLEQIISDYTSTEVYDVINSNKMLYVLWNIFRNLYL